MRSTRYMHRFIIVEAELEDTYRVECCVRSVVMIERWRLERKEKCEVPYHITHTHMMMMLMMLMMIDRIII